MSFHGFQAKYKRLHHEHAAWRLLRTDNAPYVLAFISVLFKENTEVTYGQAKILLEEELKQSRELGIWTTDTSAGSYLNQWIRSGWLREMDDTLTKTDSSELALRFCKNLDDRGTGTSASHLRIVQEAVRDLAAAMSPNIDDKIELLERKKKSIEQEIHKIKSGNYIPLTDREQKESIREIYQLASVLTGDFRRVEDEIRQLDKSLRVQIVEGNSSRGEVILNMMEKEAILANSEAGSAFEGFYQLLCDQNRELEFREQLKMILSHPIAKTLPPSNTQFLAQLMRELTRESDRVFNVRRRTEEGLRSYIESGAALENKTVDRLLHALERNGLKLRDQGIDLKTELNLTLSVGPLEINSPESFRLRTLDDKLALNSIEENINSRTPSEFVLETLETVQIRKIAERIKTNLKNKGPTSIGQLIIENPIRAGLEELVAYLRIAKALNAVELNEKESVLVKDRHGLMIEAKVPVILVSEDLFPDDLDELGI
ncbi:DUF3375 domain-containing protein [Thorsellia kenyensis]|uniref:DUF3375 domain-containing protein n=1 Tax=Thorsellia kenyensis TaxID=1549888 RepID=A0ABV6C8F3_9GAMM